MSALESDRGRLTVGTSLCLPDASPNKVAFTGCGEDAGHDAGKVGSVCRTCSRSSVSYGDDGEEHDTPLAFCQARVSPNFPFKSEEEGSESGYSINVLGFSSL